MTKNNYEAKKIKPIEESLMTERATWRGALGRAGMATGLVLTAAACGPVSNSGNSGPELPPNPCTSLVPFDTHTAGVNSLSEAAACAKQLKGKVLIVDFAKLSSGTEKSIEELAGSDEIASSGGRITAPISVIPASLEADKAYQLTREKYLTPNGCLSPSMPAEASPAATAWKTMRTVKNAALVVALSPDALCGNKNGNENGGLYDGRAYLKTIFADVYLGNTGLYVGLIASTIDHEGPAGHLYGDGHIGYFHGYNEDNSYSTNSYSTFNKSGPIIDLPASYFNVGKTHGKYFEYDQTTVMGMVNLGPRDKVPAGTPIDLADLTWAESLLKGSPDFPGKVLEADGSVSITQKEAKQGAFAIVPLQKSIDLTGYNDAVTKFDNVIFIPHQDPHGSNPPSDRNALDVWLYDSKTRNKAFLGIDHLDNLPSGEQKFTIYGTELLIKTSKNGITIRNLKTNLSTY